MIDSHAHIINEFYSDIDEIVLEIKNKGIIGVINCGDGIDTSKEVIKVHEKYNILKPAVGIHPENINNIDKIDELEDLIKNNKVYAIGEIGLDYYWNKENKEEQKDLFIKQLDLAIKYDLPVIIHTRDSIQDCYDILKDRKNRGVIHCFTGSVEMAKMFIKKGYKLGIGGVLTFKNSNLYKVIENIDLESILLETDSPFLSPEPFRGKINIPSNVYYVASRIAEIKNISIEEVINNTKKNASKLFDINLN
jgi:TatD DNase family protein